MLIKEQEKTAQHIVRAFFQTLSGFNLPHLCSCFSTKRGKRAELPATQDGEQGETGEANNSDTDRKQRRRRQPADLLLQSTPESWCVLTHNTWPTTHDPPPQNTEHSLLSGSCPPRAACFAHFFYILLYRLLNALLVNKFFLFNFKIRGRQVACCSSLALSLWETALRRPPPRCPSAGCACCLRKLSLYEGTGDYNSAPRRGWVRSFTTHNLRPQLPAQLKGAATTTHGLLRR